MRSDLAKGRWLFQPVIPESGNHRLEACATVRERPAGSRSMTGFQPVKATAVRRRSICAWSVLWPSRRASVFGGGRPRGGSRGAGPRRAVAPRGSHAAQARRRPCLTFSSAAREPTAAHQRRHSDRHHAKHRAHAARCAPSIAPPRTNNSNCKGSTKLLRYQAQAQRPFEHEVRLKQCWRARPSSTRPSTSTKATPRPRKRWPILTYQERSQTPRHPRSPDPTTEKGKGDAARPLHRVLFLLYRPYYSTINLPGSLN
jgi:hypothetical protein